MSEIKFYELKCQRCGGELEEVNGLYACRGCGKKWQRETLRGFADMLEACEEALRGQRAADIANSRRLLWTETHKEFVSNKEVERLCNEIKKYIPDDFYADFYLATCSKSKDALGSFLCSVDADGRYDDIPLMLDYLLKALRPEWVMAVSNFIEKIKDVDLGLYNGYRTRFEEEYEKTEECVFEPALPRDVFVAYSSKDMDKVTELVSVLEDENLTCFVAARNMRHGSGSVENYGKTLREAIDHCSVIAFVSSDNSRSVRCDAYKELDYVSKNCAHKPRVEYVIKNYSGRASERFFEDFFKGLEYCTSPKDVAARVNTLIMSGVNGDETPTKDDEKPLQDAENEKTEDISDRALALKKAKMLAVEGNYGQAKKIYAQLKAANPDDMGAYVGLIRVASENFHRFDGDGIEESLRVAQDMFGKKLYIDSDYRQYISARNKHLSSSVTAAESKTKAAKPRVKAAGREEYVKNPDGRNGAVKLFNAKDLYLKRTKILTCVLAAVLLAAPILAAIAVNDEYSGLWALAAVVAEVQLVLCVFNYATAKNKVHLITCILMWVLLAGSTFCFVINMIIEPLFEDLAVTAFIIFGTGVTAVLCSLLLFFNFFRGEIKYPKNKSYLISHALMTVLGLFNLIFAIYVIVHLP